MTTLPIHTVQHVKSVFTKYQIFAILFTAITLIAAFLTVVSGFQLAKLQKLQKVETQMTPEPVQPAPAAANDKLDKQIISLENQLRIEKTTSQELRLQIQDLKNKIAVLRNPPPHPTQPVVEEKTTVVLPKLTPPPAQAPAPEPSRPPVQTRIKTSPDTPTAQQPETKTMVPTKPAEAQPPATTQPAVPPAPPAAVKKQSIQNAAPSQAIKAAVPHDENHQPIIESSPALPSKTTQQITPEKTDNAAVVTQDSPAKPTSVPSDESQTGAAPEPGSTQTPVIKEETLTPVQKSAEENQTKP